jgi:hypothetical protein
MKPLLTAMEEARERYPRARVLGAVLAASVVGDANLQKFYYHQLSESKTIDVSYDASNTEFVMENDDFILGASSADPKSRLPIGRTMLDLARNDMARLWRDEVV